MKWKSFFIGLGTGAALALFSKQYISNKYISSEEILQKVKNTLKSTGKITGSWIISKPEPLQNSESQNTVYRGGISLLQDEKTVYFEFSADAKTGKIIKLDEQTG